jgi:NADH:ubiquinone oxidoreductase subunit 5 (subunit L)/multisubunit Na+/H+ antiporter MnhA subunit
MIYWAKKYFTDPSAHFEAAYEVFVVFAFSLAPFFVAYFINASRLSNSSTFEDLFGRGQIYLLAYALFGTIFWLAFLKSGRPRHGARVFLGFLATLLVFPLVGFLGVDPTFSTVINSSVVRFGFILYAILLTIYYLLLFYMDVQPPEPREIFIREVSEMRVRYEEMTDDE